MTHQHIKYASMLDGKLIISVITTNKQVHPRIDTLKTVTVSDANAILTPDAFRNKDVLFTVDDQHYKITNDTIVARNVYEYIQVPMWRKTINAWIRRIFPTNKSKKQGVSSNGRINRRT